MQVEIIDNRGDLVGIHKDVKSYEIKDYTNKISGKPDPLLRHTKGATHLSSIFHFYPHAKISDCETQEILTFKDISPW